MRNLHKIVILGFLFIIVSCSTKKDAFLNRKYNALSTQYNILYNGEVAFQQGIQNINSRYEDDFFELLPIEPLKFERSRVKTSDFISKMKGPGAGFSSNKNTTQETQSPFDIAEQKAVKAIQKHSMNINGKEKNKKIDDAYLLLGKSRYYTERFIPAIDAYNYIISNYPNASLINETKIWRAKAHIRIDNEELAIETLELLLKQSELPDQIREQANTALAMAYIKIDSIQEAKKYLWRATKTSENKDQKARNLFILGQLYGKEKIKDSASLVLDKLINLKRGPYKYKVYAAIELAKNTISDSSTIALLDRYRKMIRNRDNRPYLDGLFYQVAVLEESRDSIDLAILNYNESLRKKGAVKQKTYSYENLAKIYFKQLDYVTAGFYYDSVLQISPNKQTARIKRIERKAKNLATLIKYEKILKNNDSILSLALMSKEELQTYFQDYIDKIKKKDEELAQRKLNAISFGSSFGGQIKSSKTNGKWYFYNVQSLGYGKAEFERVWGNRSLEDNWRWSDKTIISKEEKQIEVVDNQKIMRYELSTYLESVPQTLKEIDSLTFERNKALFELGLIYKERFKNRPKSIKNLERLLASKPREELILPANYHLYELYSEEEEEVKSNEYKNVVLKNYPESPFAKIILNPKATLSKEKKINEDSEVYKIAYRLYKDDFFEEAICFIDMTIPTLVENNRLISKFELLKAYAIGKYQKKESYIAALEKVAVDYPQTEQGKKALEIMKRLKK